MSELTWPRLVLAMIALMLAVATLAEVAVVAGSLGQEVVNSALQGSEIACADAFFIVDDVAKTSCIVE